MRKDPASGSASFANGTDALPPLRLGIREGATSRFNAMPVPDAHLVIQFADVGPLAIFHA
ncbi:hypothetical protein ATN79_12115 [Paraburkholderia caribensis]|nr:hypothetical protein ATN79_12115 [Paraburkholderia caribensis]